MLDQALDRLDFGTHNLDRANVPSEKWRQSFLPVFHRLVLDPDLEAVHAAPHAPEVRRRAGRHGHHPDREPQGVVQLAALVARAMRDVADRLLEGRLLRHTHNISRDAPSEK
jgi:hypothetical protein